MPDSTTPTGGPGDGDILRLMLLLMKVLPAYNRAVTHLVRSDPQHAADPHLVKDSGYKRLLTFDAMVWLMVVWRMSNFPSKEACESVGIPHGSEMERVTCNMLGQASLNDLDLPDDIAAKIGAEGFIMSCRRVMDAAIEYGFVIKEDVRPNYKPLHATDKLHELMLDMIKDFRAS